MEQLIKERAADLLHVKPKEVSHFEQVDTFNGNNLEGYICRRSDYRYGSMVLTRVNNESCEQIIHCTPKLSYPFDKHGKFHWEKIDCVEVWDKLDGSNVLSYTYLHQGKKYITFKLRLTPVIRNSKFGKFLDMWLDYLDNNPWVYEVIKLNPDYNLSFELYGSRNPITVIYDTPLAAALLFGVHKERHQIAPPSHLSIPPGAALPERMKADTRQDLTALYCSLRECMTDKISAAAEEYILEGAVMYAKTLTEWKQFKVKASQVEQLHWSQSGIIPKIHLWNTALNVFESVDDPTIEDFKTLLVEEYPQEKIDKNEKKIAKCFKKARAHMLFNARVNSIWQEAKDEGLDITKNKGDTFRFMSKYFNKKEMRRVGTIILTQAGLK